MTLPKQKPKPSRIKRGVYILRSDDRRIETGARRRAIRRAEMLDMVLAEGLLELSSKRRAR